MESSYIAHNSAKELIMLSQEEYRKIQGLFKKNPSPSIEPMPSTTVAHSDKQCLLSVCPISWIIDSGTFDHIIGAQQVFTSLSFSSFNSLVTLVHGPSTKIDGRGKTRPTSNLSLGSSWYIPQSPMSLLSINKLAKPLNCSVTLFTSYCIFQNLKREDD